MKVRVSVREKYVIVKKTEENGGEEVINKAVKEKKARCLWGEEDTRRLMTKVSEIS